jgi:hypothetical protein
VVTRRGFVLLIAAVVLVGLAQLLVLPPFEGFDETAHYSYIREIADTRTIPIFGQSTIAKLVAEYHRWGPMPYASVVPFNQNGGWTYQTFAANAGARERYRDRYRRPDVSARRYQTTSELNWETQHPPLYYALLAPVMRATDGLSFNAQFLVLRLVSYVLALLGLLIGLYGTLRFLPGASSTTRAQVAGTFLYPFLVPMFLPEFARLGNDSLCMFFVGTAWLALLAVTADPNQRTPALLLGLSIGLGLLTKAFFLPIGSGACGYLFYRCYAARHDPRLARARLQQAVLATLLAILIGGWWYVYKFVAFHSVTGGAELMNLDAQGGLLPNLQQKFAIRYFARGFVALLATAYYTSTWSLARLPEWLYIPGLALLFVIGIGVCRRLRQSELSAPDWAPVWLAAPIVGGFLYFILARIALTESGNNIGGWYFNILAPAITVLFGFGLQDAISRQWTRWLAAVLGAYAALFFIAGQWAQTTLYAGCAIKTAENKYYVFPDAYFCFNRMSDASSHLSVIGWPGAAATCFLIGLLCLALGTRSLMSRAAEA